MPKAAKFIDLPQEYKCNLCEATKPIGEMMVVYVRKEKIFRLRPRCKQCHNERERGHRREYKTAYNRRWRKANPELNRSYWKDDPDIREKSRLRAAKQWAKDHDALLIQARIRRRTGKGITIVEARELLAKFGPNYPSKYGLTKAGLKACERIRGSNRRRTGKQTLTSFEIRMMVYEDSLEDPILLKKPSTQKFPYKKRSALMRKWRAKVEAERKAA